MKQDTRQAQIQTQHQKGGETMKEQQVQQNQQAQNQIQTQHQQGGEAMERKKQVSQAQQKTQGGGNAMQQDQQTTICFITFQCKVDRETARQIVAELRKRFPSRTLIFTARPPSGKKIITNINGILVVVTIPYSNRQEDPKEGFKLSDLIKKN